jgi:hypothetical protein
MAAPITHIVLAEKVFGVALSRFSKKDFLIGTSFPDIRYLKVIDRDSTHFKKVNVDFESLGVDESFIAGAKFHAMTDEIREEFMVSRDVFSLLPKSKYIPQSLKLFEDEMLFEKIDSWAAIANGFESIPFEKIPFKLNQKDIERWYSLIREYVSERPKPETRKKFILEIGFPAEAADEMNELVKGARENDQLHKVITEFYDTFASLLKSFINE